MASTEQLLLLYDELDDAERKAADAHIRRHPQARALIEEGRRLRRLIEAGAASELSDQVLAAVVVARASHGDEPLAALAERIDQARQEDPELDARYRRLEQRLHEVGRELPPASTQFERLTGTGEQDPKSNPPRRSRAPDRGMSETRRGPRSTRFRTGALVLLAAGIIGGLLIAISHATTPRHVALAALHELPETSEPPRLRGPEVELPMAALHYARALETIRDSRRTTVGLFQRYDEDRLRAAATLLEQVRADQPTDSALALEATFVLARVHLHLGEPARARGLLGEVVQREGPGAPEAETLLRALERRR